MIGSVMRSVNGTSLCYPAAGDHGVTTSVYPVGSYLRGMGVGLLVADLGAMKRNSSRPDHQGGAARLQARTDSHAPANDVEVGRWYRPVLFRARCARRVRAADLTVERWWPGSAGRAA